MDLSPEEKIAVNRALRFGVALVAAAATALLARGARRAGLTADEAEAVVAWKQRVDARFGLAAIVLWAVATAGLTYGFHHAELFRDRQLPPFLFLHCPFGAPPDYLPWAAPAGVVALVVAAAGRRLLMRAVLGSMGMRVYRRATNVVRGFDARRLGRVVVALLVPVTLLWVVLALDWYCRVEADRIVVNCLWSLGETSYRYEDVALLVETSHWQVAGRLRPADGFHVVFRDGTYWSFPGRAEVRQPLTDHLTRKTRLRPLSVPVIEDVLPGRQSFAR